MGVLPSVEETLALSSPAEAGNTVRTAYLPLEFVVVRQLFIYPRHVHVSKYRDF